MYLTNVISFYLRSVDASTIVRMAKILLSLKSHLVNTSKHKTVSLNYVD